MPTDPMTETPMSEKRSKDKDRLLSYFAEQCDGQPDCDVPHAALDRLINRISSLESRLAKAEEERDTAHDNVHKLSLALGRKDGEIMALRQQVYDLERKPQSPGVLTEEPK